MVGGCGVDAMCRITLDEDSTNPSDVFNDGVMCYFLKSGHTLSSGIASAKMISMLVTMTAQRRQLLTLIKLKDAQHILLLLGLRNFFNGLLRLTITAEYHM